jgi:N utilization substance protein B
MLNRRILRVKAMQALYAYFTAVESTKEVAREQLKQTHSLDPAKHDFSDKGLFEQRKRQAVRLFNENMQNGQLTTSEDVEETVTSSVQTAISQFQTSIANDARRKKKEMLQEATNIQNIYLKFLILPIELEHREKLEKEKYENQHFKKEPKFFPFLDNTTVQILKQSEVLLGEVKKNHIEWNNEQDEIKNWYRDHIRPNESLASYFDMSSEEEDNLILDVFKKVVFKNEDIVAFFEKNYLHWSENQPIIKSMVIKSLKTLKEEGKLTFAELTKNGEDDFKFLERLYIDVIQQNEWLDDLIANHTRNWDVDRIAITDRIILKLALVEMMNSPSIPVKVTINEAIEISKTYSTPKSKQFINGVLDVLSNELTSLGKIRKSGRGLIDNR